VISDCHNTLLVPEGDCKCSEFSERVGDEFLFSTSVGGGRGESGGEEELGRGTIPAACAGVLVLCAAIRDQTCFQFFCNNENREENGLELRRLASGAA
jgi:hypothetical protein